MTIFVIPNCYLEETIFDLMHWRTSFVELELSMIANTYLTFQAQQSINESPLLLVREKLLTTHSNYVQHFHKGLQENCVSDVVRKPSNLIVLLETLCACTAKCCTKVSWPDSVTYLDRTPLFECCVVKVWI